MEYSIVLGKQENLHACCKMLEKSELGKIYFTDKCPRRMLSKGLENEEVYVVVNEQKKCIGFILFELNGTFGKYPNLRFIVVEEEFQGKGIGSSLLSYFEKEVTGDYDKIFLLVGDFNERAKALYQKLDYEEIGRLPDFYTAGVTEYLMGKHK